MAASTAVRSGRPSGAHSARSRPPGRPEPPRRRREAVLHAAAAVARRQVDLRRRRARRPVAELRERASPHRLDPLARRPPDRRRPAVVAQHGQHRRARCARILLGVEHAQPRQRRDHAAAAPHHPLAHLRVVEQRRQHRAQVLVRRIPRHLTPVEQRVDAPVPAVMPAAVAPLEARPRCLGAVILDPDLQPLESRHRRHHIERELQHARLVGDERAVVGKEDLRYRLRARRRRHAEVEARHECLDRLLHRAERQQRPHRPGAVALHHASFAANARRQACACLG